ncbi:MAG TPA: dihydropteroate synthase [bacterium]|nr:dihydropteroate synthase [bacterium]
MIIRGKAFDFDAPAVMGILNVTPDSFFDGGVYKSAEEAAEAGLKMAGDGAAIIDIGGESSRPGAKPAGQEEEIFRVIPVIEAFRKKDRETPLSIDTYRAGTAEAALKAGADMINDISAGRFEPQIMEAAALTGAPYVIMHMLGEPATMQKSPAYSAKGIVADIKDFFRERRAAAISAGIKKEQLILDPGFGFGKSVKDNFELLNRLEEFLEFEAPILAGMSRKSMIGSAAGADSPADRLFGSLAAAAIAVMNGASIIRAHDVKETVQAVKTAAAARHYKKAER